MASIRLTTHIKAGQQRCFDLSRSIDLQMRSMSKSRERAVAGVTSGLIDLGEEVTWEARHFGVKWRMTTRITESQPPGRFVDEMARGPFAMFRHEHRFEPTPSGTRMQDIVELKTRPALIRSIADPIAAAYIRRLLLVRNEVIRHEAESSTGI